MELIFANVRGYADGPGSIRLRNMADSFIAPCEGTILKRISPEMRTEKMVDATECNASWSCIFSSKGIRLAWARRNEKYKGQLENVVIRINSYVFAMNVYFGLSNFEFRLVRTSVPKGAENFRKELVIWWSYFIANYHFKCNHCGTFIYSGLDYLNHGYTAVGSSFLSN